MPLPINSPSKSSAPAILALAVLALSGCDPGDPRPESPAGPSSRASSSPPAGTAARPDLLLITVDTLRPDALGWIGGANATPALDDLAASGVAFAHAVAPVPLTLPSHASMFSGLVPRRHGVRDNHQVVGSGPPLLAERLAAAGYDTAAVVSGFPLSASFGLDRGFRRYGDELTSGDGAWLERPAGETAAAARETLAELASPWHLWVHFYDPHYPYEPPEGFGGTGFRAAYDGEVAYVDTEIAGLLAAARDRSENLLTVFTSDHGEALGEHGESTHGFFVYDDTQLVPLVFHWPARLAPARRETAARLVDLSPTLLDLLELEPLPASDGVSLRPLLEGHDFAIPAAYLETLQPWNSYGWAPLSAIRHDGWKLIVAPRPELYDLANDPDEATNVYDARRERARELQSLLRDAESRSAASADAVEDPETLAQLRALGYLGSSEDREIPPISALRDPKDQVELREILTEADERLRRQDFEATLRLCRRALALDGENRFAQLRLGLALRGAGAVEEAARALGRAVELNPADPEARAVYAEVLAEAGRAGEAIEHWMEVARLQPRRVSAWSNLGAVLGLSGQPARAVAAYETAADLEPENPERWIRLGFAAFGAGDVSRAIGALERAARITTPEAFPHSGALGLLLLRAGRSADAEAWLERARPAEGDFPQALLALVELRIEQGSPEEARRLLAAALRERPDLRAMISNRPDLAELLRSTGR